MSRGVFRDMRQEFLVSWCVKPEVSDEEAKTRVGDTNRSITSNILVRPSAAISCSEREHLASLRPVLSTNLNLVLCEGLDSDVSREMVTCVP